MFCFLNLFEISFCIPMQPCEGEGFSSSWKVSFPDHIRIFYLQENGNVACQMGGGTKILVKSRHWHQIHF